MIISMLNQKGGVGKTTLCINLAGALAKSGYKVLVVDADPQGSSLAWSAVRQDDPLFPVIGMAKATLHKDLPDVAAGYDMVLIDGAPRVNELARSAIIASDLILIPVQPSPLDVWASDEIVSLIDEARIYQQNLKAAFVINRKIANTAIGRDVHEAFAGQAYPVLAETICQRVIFAESFATGQTVIETEPNGLAANEVKKLTKSIMQLFKEGSHEQEISPICAASA